MANVKFCVALRVGERGVFKNTEKMKKGRYMVFVYHPFFIPLHLGACLWIQSSYGL